jgi:RAB6-interacting golgin
LKFFRKRYEKAEKEFVEAKLDLHSKSERKEQLTGHLYTIIYQNEVRKAKKLAELMEKLEMECAAEDLTVDLPPLPHITPMNFVQTLGPRGPVSPSHATRNPLSHEDCNAAAKKSSPVTAQPTNPVTSQPTSPQKDRPATDRKEYLESSLRSAESSSEDKSVAKKIDTNSADEKNVCDGSVSGELVVESVVDKNSVNDESTDNKSSGVKEDLAQNNNSKIGTNEANPVC